MLLLGDTANTLLAMETSQQFEAYSGLTVNWTKLALMALDSHFLDVDNRGLTIPVVSSYKYLSIIITLVTTDLNVAPQTPRGF